MDSSGKPLSIVQITDPHLRRESEGTLLGMKTRESLTAVLELAKKAGHQPDLILATGDIAQDGSREAYRQFHRMLEDWNSPVYWLAGNHDNREAMAAVAEDLGHLVKVVHAGGWQIVLLDSSVPGKVYGFLEAEELQLLEKTLQDYPDVPTLVCLHHHPIDVGSHWIDNIGLRNRDALLSIVDKHAQVKGILWGHIHQEVDDHHKAVRLLATPSTCVQFKPATQDFAVDDLAPGYRWLKLWPDGRIDTGVERAAHLEFEVDLSSKGY